MKYLAARLFIITYGDNDSTLSPQGEINGKFQIRITERDETEFYAFDLRLTYVNNGQFNPTLHTSTYQWQSTSDESKRFERDCKFQD